MTGGAFARITSGCRARSSFAPAWICSAPTPKSRSRCGRCGPPTILASQAPAETPQTAPSSAGRPRRYSISTPMRRSRSCAGAASVIAAAQPLMREFSPSHRAPIHREPYAVRGPVPMTALGQSGLRHPSFDVCFTPESGHRAARLSCPLSANSGHRSVYSSSLSAHMMFENQRVRLRGDSHVANKRTIKSNDHKKDHGQKTR